MIYKCGVGNADSIKDFLTGFYKEMILEKCLYSQVSLKQCACYSGPALWDQGYFVHFFILRI